MRAGQAIGNKNELTSDDLAIIMDAALQGIKVRGKAEKGEKQS